MKVTLAEHLGICFGVRDAIAQAEQLAASGPLAILGELVHNPVVRERLSERGVTAASLNQPNVMPSRVMITAHGVSDATRDWLRGTSAMVADGTCPLVRHAHHQLKALVAGGFFPVVIGKQGHVEVNGLIGDFPEAVVLGEPHDIARLPRRPRYGIISQTTQPIELVRLIVDLVRQIHPESEIRFVDTVCKPTKDRQSALQRLFAETEVIVVVGGRMSNNTRQLVETCRTAGKRVIHVERAEELNSQDFFGVSAVGVTAGTSTLQETVEQVRLRLLSFSENV